MIDAPPAPTVVDAVPRPRPAARERLGDAAVGAVLAYWATYLTWGTGGREPHRLSYLAALVLVAFAVVQPWRSVSPRLLLWANALGLAAGLVVLTAPTGLEGRDEAASYAIVGQLVVLVAAWAKDPIRRLAVVAAVLVFGILQLSMGWLAWWGGADPSNPFIGTFYWHNQAGIALAAAAVAAYGCLLLLDGPLRTLSWVVAPLAAAGTVVSTSRASMGGLVLGLVVVLALGAWQRAWRASARVLVAAAAGWVTSLVLVSPVFFASADGGGVSPLAGTSARGAAEPLSGNTDARLYSWDLAVDVFREWPLTGAGFHGFKSASSQLVGEPQQFAHSHNGFLQAAADGGLALALPVWIGALAFAWIVLRRVVREGRALEPALLVALPVLGLLVLHAGMDFDWSYPALACATGLVAAIFLTAPSVDESTHSRRAGAAVALTLLVLAAVGAWGGGLDLNATVGGGA
ncbi:MAG: O-antigen ligase family protein [Mycobacteriales bacterium]|nr:O-antigen ligase family protein [Mycobacteriales bacterium]